eukprot:921894-Rhodomonas_salina.2
MTGFGGRGPFFSDGFRGPWSRGGGAAVQQEDRGGGEVWRKLPARLPLRLRRSYTLRATTIGSYAVPIGYYAAPRAGGQSIGLGYYFLRAPAIQRKVPTVDLSSYAHPTRCPVLTCRSVACCPTLLLGDARN